MEETTKGWGLIIVLFLLFIVFGNNGMFGNHGNYYSNMNWDNERQEILDSAKTQFLIEQQTASSIAATMNAQNVLGTKIDYYGYQDLRDKNAEQAAKIAQLETQLYANAQFGILNSRLDRMECSMLKRPPLWGQVVVPSGTLVPSETTTTTTAGA